MTDKEILQLRLENAQLRHANINLQGLLLSRDLKEIEGVIAEIESQLAMVEGQNNAQI